MGWVPADTDTHACVLSWPLVVWHPMRSVALTMVLS